MSSSTPWRLSVLNAGGRDAAQTFPDGAGQPDDRAQPHPPVNYHGYAACTAGSFDVAPAGIAAERPILLLLRRDLAASLRVLRRLKASGRTAAVTFKEAGAVQLAARLSNAASMRLLREILELAGGFIAPTPHLENFLGSICPNAVGEFIPTPYPLEAARWNFSRPGAERRGIFIGTREFDVPARQHLAALLAAARVHRLTGERVTVINTEGRAGRRLLAEIGFSPAPAAALRWLEGPLGYPAYLREMSAHRLVFQLDRSGVPGQVAGDALLCRLPCVGGDSAIEELAFAELSAHRRTPAEIIHLAHQFLTEPARAEEAVRASQSAGLATVSFEIVARKLHTFFDSLATGAGRTEVPARMIMDTDSPWTLYVKTGCMWCVMAASYLRKHGYHFEEVNVSRDPEAYRRMQTLSGQSYTPTLGIRDDLLLPDFDTGQLETFLRAHNLLRV